jgi:hypothetical protein
MGVREPVKEDRDASEGSSSGSAKFAACASQGYTGSAPYPINFFEANPYASGGLEYQDSNGNA